MAKDKFNPEEWLNQPTNSNTAVIPGSTGDPTPNVIPDPDRASNDIETITHRIEARCLDITASYDNWRDLGFALSEELGEIGRDYYHRISRFNPDYDQAETDKQYDRCLHAQGTGVTIKTFFKKAKEAGISIVTSTATKSAISAKSTISALRPNADITHKSATSNNAEIADIAETAEIDPPPSVHKHSKTSRLPKENRKHKQLRARL